MSQNPDMFSLLAEHFERVTATDRMDFGIENWYETLKAVHNGGDLGDALRIVVAILPKLEPVELSVATRLLADGSRYGKSKRYRIHDMTQGHSDAVKNHGDFLLECMVYWISTWTIWLKNKTNRPGLQIFCDSLVTLVLIWVRWSFHNQVREPLSRSLDMNRERVIAKVDFDALIDRLRYDEQVDLAIVVLNNLCSEYGAPLSSLHMAVTHSF